MNIGGKTPKLNDHTAIRIPSLEVPQFFRHENGHAPVDKGWSGDFHFAISENPNPGFVSKLRPFGLSLPLRSFAMLQRLYMCRMEGWSIGDATAAHKSAEGRYKHYEWSHLIVVEKREAVKR